MNNVSTWTRKFLILSLAVNLIFFFLFGYIVYKKGGANYLAKQIKSILQSDKASSGKRKLSYKARYFYRKSIYEALPDEENEIILLGDSITDNGEWGELFKDLKIKNRGIQGDRTDGVLKRLPEVLSSSPQKIFLLIGYNDLSKGVKIETILLNYKEILQTIDTQSTKTKVYVQSVLPAKYDAYKGKVKNHQVIKLNKRLKQLSEKFNVTYLDLFSQFCDTDQQLHPDFAGPDGLHLNGRAYLKWKSILENHVYN
jgi:lysophospholipase L1-like esterase